MPSTKVSWRSCCSVLIEASKSRCSAGSPHSDARRVGPVEHAPPHADARGCAPGARRCGRAAASSGSDSKSKVSKWLTPSRQMNRDQVIEVRVEPAGRLPGRAPPGTISSTIVPAGRVDGEVRPADDLLGELEGGGDGLVRGLGVAGSSPATSPSCHGSSRDIARVRW